MSGTKILLVDDDEMVRSIFQEMLENKGYDVVALGSASAALEESKKTRFNLLLTDIRMPDMDGLQLVRKFRELNPQTGAILITGYPDVDTARAGIQQGVYDYIVKPVKQAELCAAVASALQKQERIQMLERTARELEELEKARSQFVDVLSHELMTSLTPVLGCAEILADQLKDQTEKKHNMLAHALFQSAQSMRLRLENLLTLTRLEAGDFVPNLSPLDPVELLSRLARQIKNLVDEKRQVFTLDLPDSLPAVQADQQCLVQVLTNLLDNAVKFTQEGGSISLQAEVSGDDLVVKIRDNGVSMSDEDCQRLLRPYWRSEVDRQHLPGSGLGLAICQRVIDLHKGRLWIENRPGPGKTFAFALPLGGSR